MGWGSTERRLLIVLAVTLASALAWSSSGMATVDPQRLPSLMVDANTVPMAVLGALPGLGPALSGRIVEARELSPLRSIDDLDRRVKGIGPAKVASIRPFLRFDPAPVSHP
jgi:DNA uptake protein ComE-like DNA-binding protein